MKKALDLMNPGLNFQKMTLSRKAYKRVKKLQNEIEMQRSLNKVWQSIKTRLDHQAVLRTRPRTTENPHNFIINYSILSN